MMVPSRWPLLVLLFLMNYLPSMAIHGRCNGHKMIQSGGLTCQERHLILHEHNKLRQSVALGKINGQPSASNMREMVWDDYLASVAQTWADQCTIAHDMGRSDGRFPVGQNLAATWTTRSSVNPAPDFTPQIREWFNEVSLFRYGLTGFTEATGHYSQVAWGDTYLVGCGYSFYYDRSLGYTKLYICNYGPGGNVIGEEPYLKGSPSCNSHGMRPSTRYPGLCGVEGYSSPDSACANAITQDYREEITSPRPRYQYNSAHSFYYGR